MAFLSVIRRWHFRHHVASATTVSYPAATWRVNLLAVDS